MEVREGVVAFGKIGMAQMPKEVMTAHDMKTGSLGNSDCIGGDEHRISSNNESYLSGVASTRKTVNSSMRLVLNSGKLWFLSTNDELYR